MFYQLKAATQGISFLVFVDLLITGQQFNHLKLNSCKHNTKVFIVARGLNLKDQTQLSIKKVNLDYQRYIKLQCLVLIQIN